MTPSIKTDNQSIVDIAIREPKATTLLTMALLYNGSPNAARTLQLTREQARDKVMKDRLESGVKRNEPERVEACGPSAIQSIKNREPTVDVKAERANDEK